MDYKVFPTRKEAQTEKDQMQGWDARVTKVFYPMHIHSTRNGNAWVIEVKNGTGDPMYLRDDGYVR